LIEEIKLKGASRRAEVCLLGDVRSVIYSRASHVAAVPSVTHGIGVLTPQAPADAGEGIVFRGHAARTPPTDEAGVEIDYRLTCGGMCSSFFVGWEGEPFLWAKFSSAEGVTLNRLFETLLERVRRDLPPAQHKLILVEVLALFAPYDIHDRALRKPVNEGDVDTADRQHAPQYFKAHVILNDLKRRGAPPEKSIPLCITGIGAGPGSVSDAEFKQLCRLIFYDAPGAAAGSKREGQARTHSHAFGWRDEPALVGGLSAALAGGSGTGEVAAVENEILPEALCRAPDYVVHVDDWSMLRAALVKVFVTDLSRIRVQAVS
jgi:hypothetical protein